MRHHRWSVAALACLAVTVAGCGADDGRFNTEGLVALDCMTHQQAPPGTAYTDTDQGDLGLRLQVLRYYTLNTGVPYCDGQGPTSTDTTWAELVVSLGGSRTSVAPILDAS